ncbi:MAG: helix-turn-helix domain-containing protein [Bacteroidales bacterium]|nr:helix-turn-helix domain-containing protein [Bacteroidales bacterium]MDD3162197.1 helix-turn-helix domain-containing protein [Bacteroidales bacterium]
MDQELCSTKEAAELLGVSRPTISNWMRKGLLSKKIEKGIPLPTRESIQLILDKHKGLADLEAEVEKYTLELQEKVAQLKQKIEEKDSEEAFVSLISPMKDFIYHIASLFLTSMHDQYRMSEKEWDMISMALSGHSLFPICRKYNLSNERVRQIIGKGLRRVSRTELEFSTYISQFENIMTLKQEIESLQYCNSQLERKLKAFGPLKDDELVMLPKEKAHELFLKKLTDCGLSAKTVNDIPEDQIKTMGKLLTYSKIELMTYYNVKKSTLKEIEEYLIPYNCTFNDGEIHPIKSGETPCFKCEHSMNPMTGKLPAEKTPCLCKYGNAVVNSMDKRGCFVARNTAMVREHERNIVFSIK